MSSTSEGCGEREPLLEKHEKNPEEDMSVAEEPEVAVNTSCLSKQRLKQSEEKSEADLSTDDCNRLFVDNRSVEYKDSSSSVKDCKEEGKEEYSQISPLQKDLAAKPLRPKSFPSRKTGTMDGLKECEMESPGGNSSGGTSLMSPVSEMEPSFGSMAVDHEKDMSESKERAGKPNERPFSQEIPSSGIASETCKSFHAKKNTEDDGFRRNTFDFKQKPSLQSKAKPIRRSSSLNGNKSRESVDLDKQTSENQEKPLASETEHEVSHTADTQDQNHDITEKQQIAPRTSLPPMVSIHDRMAAFNQQVEAQLPVAEIAKKKAEQERIDKENGLTPLMLACRENKFSVVEKLIELGNPVNELDKEGKSALYHAVTSGSDSIVKCLLNAKADPNLTAGVGFLQKPLITRKLGL